MLISEIDCVSRYMSAATICAQLGDHAQAKRYAERGLEIDVDCLGVDNPIFHDSVNRLRSIIQRQPRER